MHPVEQLLYFSSALLHLLIPSNPLLAIYQLHYSGFGAVVGHIGFDKIEAGDGQRVRQRTPMRITSTTNISR